MFAKFLSRRRRTELMAPCVPDGRRFYAIGDIHGRLDLLDGLLERIAADNDERGDVEGELIFLGDYIDRGPESAGVLDRMIALKESQPKTRFLIGNHEEVFLSALSGSAKALRFFTRIGGTETVLSYGVPSEAYEDADFSELADILENVVPDSHRDFLLSLEEIIVEGDYVFVHAGLRPGVTILNQRPSDLRWIRDEFLDAKLPFEKMVVHGHTVESKVTQLPHRIGIDTGAYLYGTLTAMGFEGAQRWVLQETRSP